MVSSCAINVINADINFKRPIYITVGSTWLSWLQYWTGIGAVLASIIQDFVCLFTTVRHYPKLRSVSSIKHRSATQDKRRAVAAQTARSRFKVLSIQYVYYFRVYQRQMTLHGVGVTTKLYFAVVAAYKEQWPSRRDHSRSYILAATESPSTTLCRPLIVAFPLSSTVSEMLWVAGVAKWSIRPKSIRGMTFTRPGDKIVRNSLTGGWNNISYPEIKYPPG